MAGFLLSCSVSRQDLATVGHALSFQLGSLHPSNAQAHTHTCIAPLPAQDTESASACVGGDRGG